MKKLVKSIILLCILFLGSTLFKELELRKDMVKRRGLVAVEEFPKENFHYVGPLQENKRVVFRDKNYYILDENRKEILRFPEEYTEVRLYKENIIVKKDKYYGLLDLHGQEIFPIEYDSILHIRDDIFMLERNKKVALRDMKKFLTDFEYDKILDANEGLFLALKDEKLGILGEKGQEIFFTDYSYLSKFQEERAVIKIGDRKYSYVDKNGKKVGDREYDYVSAYNNGVAVVGKDGKKGIIDKEDNIVIPLEYDSLEIFSESIFVGEKDGKLIFVDRSNKIIELEESVEQVGKIKEGVAPIRVKDRYGFIDEKARIVIPIIYEEVGEFENGVAIAKDSKTGKYGVINKENKFVIPPKYLYFTGRIAEYFVVGDETGKEKIINLNGEELTEAKYDSITLNSNEIAIGITETGKEAIFLLGDIVEIKDVSNMSILGVSKNEVLCEDNEKITILRKNNL